MPCIVLGCKSTTAWKRLQKPRRTFFSLPLKDKNLLEKWSVIINRENRIWSPKDKICDLHFSEDLIKKCDEFIINGEKVIISRNCWRLKPGAIPTIPNQGSKPKASNTPKSGLQYSKITASIEVLSDDEECSKEEYNEATAPLNSVEISIHDSPEIIIQLPSPNWNQIELSETDSNIFYCVETMIVDRCPVIRKWAKIDFQLRKIEAGLFKSPCPQLVEDFISLETVNRVLKRIDSASQCCGISAEQMNQHGSEMVFLHGFWRSSTCALLIKESSSSRPKESAMCSFCQIAIKSINDTNEETRGTTILPIGIKRVYKRKKL